MKQQAFTCLLHDEYTGVSVLAIVLEETEQHYVVQMWKASDWASEEQRLERPRWRRE